jgi:hypothetical protein
MEQEHHGKLMFIVLGLIALIIILLGLVVIFGKKSTDTPTPSAGNEQMSEYDRYVEATTAPGSSNITDPEVQMYNDATSAPVNSVGGGGGSERERYERATSSN